MKNYNGILADLEILANEAILMLKRGDTEGALGFLEAIKEGLEINIK